MVFLMYWYQVLKDVALLLYHEDLFILVWLAICWFFLAFFIQLKEYFKSLFNPHCESPYSIKTLRTLLFQAVLLQISGVGMT